MKSFFWTSWGLLIVTALIGLLIPNLKSLPSFFYIAYLFLCAVAGSMVLVSTTVGFIRFLKSIDGK